MAVEVSVIEAVRLTGADGVSVEYPWDPSAWYLVRDDHAYLDVLMKGRNAQAKGATKLEPREEGEEDGQRWQRWNLEAELARQRRLGEITLPLKVPKGCVLRCYVIPTLLLSYRNVAAMVEDIEQELGLPAAWDASAERADRSWSRRTAIERTDPTSETVRLVEQEIDAARSIRRSPFIEPGLRSRSSFALAENALVSHWAARRSSQLRDSMDVAERSISALRVRSDLGNPKGRQEKVDAEVTRLTRLVDKSSELRNACVHLVSEVELATPIATGPIFQRDHRLRLLLRAFAPSFSEAVSETDSARSHYPPVFLNHLWEMWGAVWLVKELKSIGFVGVCSSAWALDLGWCSWRLTRGDVVLELDFEPEPVLVDYASLPAAHERDLPALEWAARNQALDAGRPFLGLEARCSPDYLIRVSVPGARYLLVGDASLASARHHGKREEKTDAKPHVVERYRRTIGWSVEDQVVRCHPMGAFVVIPSPSEDWRDFESLEGASDCTLLCPSPDGDEEARRRLMGLLSVVAPEFRQVSSEPLTRERP